MKRISILGSTGSIGENTLNIVRHLVGEFQVVGLAARSNIASLEKQAHEFQPDIVAVYDQNKARKLQQSLPNVRVVGGMEGVAAVASHTNVDLVISAMAGTLGLIPTVAAIQAGKDVGLANKEALVSGGALVMSLVREKGTNLVPIDSEHSAIFQCLNGEKKESIRRIILTSSGGPFRNYTVEQLEDISVDLALQHPTWNMGPKVTIDSSTLMNKGLEVIEAHWLFNVPLEKIDVVIHPQSIIHSMVEFVDNSILAQMGETSMIIPIQYAMTYPKRLKGSLQPFDFVKHGTLQFFQPDTKKFRCLHLAYDAIGTGGSLPCYMNAANEVLVNRFLDKQISWQEIATKLEDLMSRHQVQPINGLDDVLAIDNQARSEASRK